MSTINIEMRLPAEPTAGRPARSPTAGASPDRRAQGDGVEAVSAKPVAAASLAQVTGMVFALKDGSGYVARGSDGHYYKVEPAGGGLVYASASGPVDAALVDVTHGPVRTLRRVPTADPSRSSPQRTGIHRPELPDPGHAAGDADRAARLPAGMHPPRPGDSRGTAESMPGAHDGANPDGAITVQGNLPTEHALPDTRAEGAAAAAQTVKGSGSIFT